MKEVDRLFGTMGWCGIYKGMPALVGSYSGGASLYVYTSGKWWKYADGKQNADVTPHKCKECDSELPINEVFE